MISGFLWFVFLISVIVGLAFWRVWLRKRSNSAAAPQPMGRHEGSLPDSFFDPSPSDLFNSIHTKFKNPFQGTLTQSMVVIRALKYDRRRDCLIFIKVKGTLFEWAGKDSNSDV